MFNFKTWWYDIEKPFLKATILTLECHSNMIQTSWLRKTLYIYGIYYNSNDNGNIKISLRRMTIGSHNILSYQR
jgi:hypothetical protein